MTGGMILLGVICLLFLVIGVVSFGRPEESDGDLEHFDHEPGDPSLH